MDPLISCIGSNNVADALMQLADSSESFVGLTSYQQHTVAI